MRCWWVNHNQSAEQEIGGGYLWSPKREAGGARSHFYNNMREAAPGDRVLSFAESEIGHLGVVVDFAVHSSKPNEFGKIGPYWQEDGWLLPVQWRKIAQAVSPKALIDDLGPLLPAKYSPIRKETGGGNQKAYLAEVDETVHQLILSQPGALLEVPTGAISVAEVREQLAATEAEAIEQAHDLSETEKLRLIKARRGQGEFRDRIFALETRCRITNIDNPGLLIASHIKPWRSCETNAERLDAENGLPLAPQVDWLFDRGLLSFDDEGCVLVSSLLDPTDLQKLGLSGVVGKPTGGFTAGQRRYLVHHRGFVFLE